jgi:hypothetical protein
MVKRPSKQSQRFIDAAREHGADDNPEAFERLFAKIVPPKKEGDTAAAPRPAPRQRRVYRKRTSHTEN